MKNSITIAAALLLLASCSAPSRISYFQDIDAQQEALSVEPRLIRLQPEDKISIIVNTRDASLSNMFNLPYTTRYIGAMSDSYISPSQGVNGYIIDSEGCIDFPIVGKLSVGGLTREEVASMVKCELESRNLVKDPVVTVDFMNLTFSLMGEVAHPGRYVISKDHLTVLDAISMAGDLTIFGRRDNIKVIREQDGTQKTFMVNLCSVKDITSSEAYFIQQNDIIYVEPNDMRARQSTVNGNNVLSTSFWISLASLATSIVTTISVLTR